MERKIDKLYEDMRKIQKKIDKLRSNCDHTNQIDGWYSWRPGAINWKKLCVDCDQVLGEATTIADWPVPFYQKLRCLGDGSWVNK